MTLEERLTIARDHRKQGYNCAQCVMSSFPDITNLDENSSLNLTIGLGGGLGCGEVCGVLSSMALLEGIRVGGTPKDKAEVYGNMRKLRDSFTDKFKTVLCRELKAPGAAVSCNDLIYAGIEMYHNHLESV